MSTIKHTPTPWWDAPDHLSRTSYRTIPIYGPDKIRIAEVIITSNSKRSYEEHAANAVFIVEACNSHETLLEALRKCKAAVENTELPPSARMELVRDYATPAIEQAIK